MQTCWTSLPYALFRDANRGPWAGHRFDIVTLETHKAQEKLSEWSDASASILQKAHRLRTLVSNLELVF